MLALYLKSENKRWRSEALELAKQLINTPPSKRGGFHVYPYHHLICDHGGEEYLDYFKGHVEKERCQFAMRALGRLLPRQEYLSMLRDKKFYVLYLEEEGDAAIAFLREQNAYLDKPFLDELGETYAVYPLKTKRIRQTPVNSPN